MTLPISQTNLPPLPPVQIDWRYHYAFRDLALQLIDQGAELPKYLLAPEVNQLLQYCTHDHSRFLINFLWNTGARITEALTATPADVAFGQDGRAMITLVNLKRAGKGRPKGNKPVKRIVPLLDPQFTAELKRYLVTHVKNKKLPIFANAKDRTKPISAQTARNWLADTRRAAERDGVVLPEGITIHSLRHSYSVNLLLSGIRLKQLQLWLGHCDPSSTEVYTRLLAIDTGLAYQPVTFTIAPGDNPLLPGSRVEGGQLT